jgi:hypothetical protein
VLLSSSARDEVADLLASGHKILAIKLVREKTGVGLREAKRIVEHLEQQPEFQLRMASSGAGTEALPAAGRPWLFIVVFLLGFAGTGVGLLCGAAAVYASQQKVIARGQRVEGKVVELVHRNNAYAPVFEYELNGQVHTYRSSTATNPPSVAVGDTVMLWVDPVNHERVVIDTFAERYLVLVILGPMGVLFTIIGIAPLGISLFRRTERDDSRGQFADPMRMDR